MTWTLSEDLDDYLATAGEFLRSRPVQNTVQLSVLETLRARGASAYGDLAPLYGWHRMASGEVTAAMLQTPPHPVLLTSLPGGSAAPLAEALFSCRRQLPGVNACEADAAAFAAARTRLTAAGAQESVRSRLASVYTPAEHRGPGECGRAGARPAAEQIPAGVALPARRGSPWKRHDGEGHDEG